MASAKGALPYLIARGLLMSARQKHKQASSSWTRNEVWDAECQIRAMQALRRELEHLTDDEEVIRDTLEGETDLGEILDALLKDRNRLEAEIAGIKSYIATELKATIEKKEVQIEKRERLLRLALETAGQRKWKGQVGQCYLTDGKFSVDIENEGLIPSQFWKVDPQLDKQAVKKALEEKLAELPPQFEETPEGPVERKLMEFRDESIPGARLVRGIDILNIRKA